MKKKTKAQHGKFSAAPSKGGQTLQRRRRVVETIYQVGTVDDAATAIRIPQAFVTAAKRLRAEIIRRGTAQISDATNIFTGTRCPLCETDMKPVGLILICSCGMAKPRDPSTVAGVGHIVGYGLAALAALLGPAKH